MKNGVTDGAYFFETPGTSGRAVESQLFEFVLKSAPELEGVSPDVDAFQEYFGGCDEKRIAAFWNLGKDARLVAPCPKTGTPDRFYAHLAVFNREAEEQQVVLQLRSEP